VREVEESADEWKPPTKAESKVLEARRERQDKISKLLGEYLLKGYKMLGTTCLTCDTILMRTKQGADYCVTCNELESDGVKDNPALSSEAARCLVRENQHRLLESPPTNGITTPKRMRREASSSSCGTVEQPTLGTPVVCTRSSASTALTSDYERVVSVAQSAVVDRLAWATNELRQSSSIEASTQLCTLISACAGALQSLNHCRNTSPNDV
jgi:uncharacterized Zn finger protein (UPF0148 family)